MSQIYETDIFTQINTNGEMQKTLPEVPSMYTNIQFWAMA